MIAIMFIRWKMEAILADKIYENTRHFIQDHIQSKLLTEEIQQQFINLYNGLNVHNAAQVNMEVKSLFENAKNANIVNFNNGMFKLSGQLIVGGIVVYGIGRVVNYFNIMPDHVSNFDLVAGIGVFSGAMLFCSVGH